MILLSLVSVISSDRLGSHPCLTCPSPGSGYSQLSASCAGFCPRSSPAAALPVGAPRPRACNYGSWDGRADPPCLPHAWCVWPPASGLPPVCSCDGISTTPGCLIFTCVCVCVPRRGVLCTLLHGASSLLGLHLVLSLFLKNNLSKVVVLRYLISVTRLLQKGRVDSPGSAGCVRAFIPLLC